MPAPRRHWRRLTYFSLSDLSKFSAALPVAMYRACTSLFARRRNMVQIYYHCSTTEGVLIDRCGTAADDLMEACEHAAAIVGSLVTAPSLEDWRGVGFHLTDVLRFESFTVPLSFLVA